MIPGRVDGRSASFPSIQRSLEFDVFISASCSTIGRGTSIGWCDSLVHQKRELEPFCELAIVADLHTDVGKTGTKGVLGRCDGVRVRVELCYVPVEDDRTVLRHGVASPGCAFRRAIGINVLKRRLERKCAHWERRTRIIAVVLYWTASGRNSEPVC